MLPVSHLLKREHLVKRLEAPGGGVFVIRGPAGSGKTSLVRCLSDADWVHVRVSEPDRFIRDVMQALLRSKAAVDHLAGDGPDVIADTLLDSLVEAGASLHLVLDGVDRVAEHPQADAFLRRLTEHWPRHLRLYLTTRVPLPRVGRATDRVEVTPGDLSWSADEIRELFCRVWEVPLSEEESEAIARWTGGWAPAINMVRRQMQESKGPPRLEVSSVLSDVLFDEIVALQPAPMRKLLYETSLLDVIDADIAVWVTHDVQAVATLEAARSQGLFLTPCGRGWTYFPFFQQFLRQLVAKEGPDQLRQRQLQIGQYLTDREPGCAIEHLLQAEAWSEAAELLDRQGLRLLQSEGATRVQAWVDRLPDEEKLKRPNLRSVEAATAELEGKPEVARMRYQDALDATRYRNDDVRAGVVARGMLFFTQYGPMAACVPLMEEAANLCLPDDARRLPWTHLWPAVSMMHVGQNVPTASRLMVEGFEQAWASENLVAIAVACVAYGFVYHLACGKFRRGVEILNRGLERFRENRYQAAGWLMNRGVLQWAASDVEGAWASAADAKRLVEPFPRSFNRLAAESLCALLAVDRRDVATSLFHLNALDEEDTPLQIRPWTERSWILLEVLRGDFDKADRHARTMLILLQADGERGFFAPECYLAMTRLRVAQQRYPEAVDWARKALAVAVEGSFTFWEAKASAYLAWALSLQGLVSEAGKHLRRSLELTVAEGYQAWWRLNAHDLVLEFLTWDQLPSVSGLDGRGLMERLPAREADEKLLRAEAPALTLTARQLEVLKYKARNWSVQRIAEHLVIRPTTVGYHREKIFLDLSVSNWQDALLEARRRGWSPSPTD